MKDTIAAMIIVTAASEAGNSQNINWESLELSPWLGAAKAQCNDENVVLPYYLQMGWA
jgi:hypothetical protein